MLIPEINFRRDNMEYQIRRALPEDIGPALEFALKVFMEFEAPEYPPEGAENFRSGIESKKADPDLYFSGKRVLFAALDGDKIIGVVESKGIGHISLLFVDGAYRR